MRKNKETPRAMIVRPGQNFVNLDSPLKSNQISMEHALNHGLGGRQHTHPHLIHATKLKKVEAFVDEFGIIDPDTWKKL